MESLTNPLSIHDIKCPYVQRIGKNINIGSFQGKAREIFAAVEKLVPSWDTKYLKNSNNFISSSILYKFLWALFSNYLCLQRTHTIGIDEHFSWIFFKIQPNLIECGKNKEFNQNHKRCFFSDEFFLLFFFVDTQSVF